MSRNGLAKHMPYEEDGGLSFLRQNRVGIIITALVLVGVAFLSFKFLFSAGGAQRRTSDVVMIRLPPPAATDSSSATDA